MNNDRKNTANNKKAPLIFLAVYICVMVINAIAGSGSGSSDLVVGVIAVMVVVWVVFFLFFRNVMKNKKGAPAKGFAKKANVEFSDGTAGLVQRMAERDEEDCEYGEENHKYSHDDEKRLAQLDSFLKNGIIDKEEYQVLKKRYSQSGKQ